MTRPDYVVSDIHLGAVPDRTERELVRFLERVGADGASLLIAGDLFDFWFEYGDVVPGRYFRTLAALAALVDAGMPVLLVGGNHDAWGGRFLREHVGVEFRVDPFHMLLGGRRALVAHGDGVGAGDFKYRALKAVLRSRAAIGAFRALHPELGMRLARAVSRTKAKTDEEILAEGRAAFLDAWATEQLRTDSSLSWVVCGHAHLPVLKQVEPGRYYLNAGDWVTHFTYITVTAGGPTLHIWPRDGVR
jgi:UDP-2,3-diacylglucosamine hydrolase